MTKITFRGVRTGAMEQRRSLPGSIVRLAVLMATAASLTACSLPARAVTPVTPPGVPAAPQGAYAELSGVRLWYTDTGGYGPVVVLLHANTGTSETWQPQIGPLSAAGFRVVAFDRRGWGKSFANPTTGPQPGTVAGDLDLLVQYLHIRRFHLIGIAGGTFAALDYAAVHLDRVISIVAASSTANLQDAAEVDYRTRITPPGFSSLPARFRELSPSYLGSKPEGTAAWDLLQATAQQPNSPSQPQLSPNTYAKLERITTRTLVMPSDADLYAPPDLMRQWGAHLPNAEYVLIPEAGHAAAWEQPEAFNRCVLKFLQGFRGDDLTPRASTPATTLGVTQTNQCARADSLP